MIDTASVAEWIWNNILVHSVRMKIAKAFELSEDDAKQFAILLAALHDLGKATPSFQKQAPQARIVLERENYTFEASTSQYHADLTACLLDKLLLEKIGIMNSSPISIFAIRMLLGGHHGIYPLNKRLQMILPTDLGTGKWCEAREEIIQDILLTVGHLKISSFNIEHVDGSTFVVLSGLISVSDWIASAEEYFPYAGNISDVKKYVILSKERTAKAFEDLNWSTQRMVEERSLRSMFSFITDPYPLQKATEDILSQLVAPGLVVIEAPMGEGKTEAALFLTERWNRSLGRCGAYVALPTQANANQMFTRILAYLKGSSYGKTTNLSLVHGHASMSEKYLQLKVRNGQEVDVSATEWFDYRRRGLLSPFGVGTIDQALLSVIPSKYFYVRLFGLAGKTVIVDEVHAYDLYTSTILDTMLQWLSALGSNVILLSATLTDARCKELIQAYSGTNFPTESAYPRITWSAGTTGSISFPSANQVGERNTPPVKIKWCSSDIISCLNEVIPKLESGGCIAIICNTVRRAQEVYGVINKKTTGTDIEVGIFHAHFMFKDRANTESKCLEKYGKQRTAKKSILVATQVIEQSLDLDFDMMISDIAPIDFILQRIGRLHRHTRVRPDAFSIPELWILSPQGNGKIDFGSSEIIYSRYALLKAYALLRNKESIQLPQEIRILVEEAYSSQLDDAFIDLGDDLRCSREKMERDASGKADKAFSAILPPPSNKRFWEYTRDLRFEDEPEAHNSVQAATRLGPPTINVIALFEGHGKYFLDRNLSEPIDIDCKSKDSIKRMMGNQIPISGQNLFNAIERIPIPSVWKEQSILRHHRPLFLTQKQSPDGSTLWRCHVGNHVLTLDEELGLLDVIE